MLKNFVDSYFINRAKFTLEGPVSPLAIERAKICPTLNTFKKPEILKNFLKVLAGSQDGRVYIATNKNLIVGYAVLHRFVHGSKFCLPKVLELGALEISKYHRRCSLASELMTCIKNDRSLEDYILVTEVKNLFRYPDPAFNDMSHDYRKEMLFKIFTKGNFSPMICGETKPTVETDSDILVKFGFRVPREIQTYFLSDLRITKPVIFKYSDNSRLL